MKSDDTTPMYDDPSESPFVRELLQAGRRAHLQNNEYDVESGLAKHLATIAAGSTAPYWMAGAAAAKRSVPLWVGYVTVPLAAAGVAGLLWVFSARPEASGASQTTDARSEAAAPEESELDATSQEGATGATESKPGERARAGAERRAARPIARPASPHATRPSARGASATSQTSRGPSELPSVVAAEGVATRGGSAEPMAANPYASSHVGSGSRDEQAQVTEAAIQNNAAPRAPEPEAAAEPAAEEEAASRGSEKQKAASRPIVDESRLEREMQMLAVTQRVLASDPERALRLAEQGEREFPDTMFSAERRQLGLLALVKLGRLEEARRAGRPFLARYPKAPWSERLRRALATGHVE